jgi:membrane protein DedA with SNARE-associated domain
MLPIWRAVVMPFAGIARVSPAKALIPMALAAAVYYGALTYLIHRLGTDLEAVLALLRQINSVLALVAGALVLIIVGWIVRRRLRK